MVKKLEYEDYEESELEFFCRYYPGRRERQSVRITDGVPEDTGRRLCLGSVINVYFKNIDKLMVT